MTQTEKARIRAKEWYKNNRDKALEKAKLKGSSSINKQIKREYDRKFRESKLNYLKEKAHKWYVNNQREMIEKAKIWKDSNPVKAQYSRYKSRAVTKNSTFSLTLEEFEKEIKSSCVYCGYNDGLLGIDRIDSSRGYERDNIVACCKVCNYLKLDHTFEEWLGAMHDIFNNLGYDITPKTEKNS